MTSLHQGNRRASASICANFGAHPELVQSTLVFLTDLSRRMLQDEDATYRFSMTLNELLENLQKYGGGTESSIEVVFNCESEPASVRLRASNLASPDRLEGLQHVADEMRAYPDPIAHYDHVIRACVDREGSGLGLARIRAEGEMQLSLSISGSEVTILAESMMPGPPSC